MEAQEKGKVYFFMGPFSNMKKKFKLKTQKTKKDKALPKAGSLTIQLQGVYYEGEEKESFYSLGIHVIELNLYTSKTTLWVLDTRCDDNICTFVQGF